MQPYVNKAKGKLLSQNAAQPVGNIIFKMNCRKMICSFRCYSLTSSLTQNFYLKVNHLTMPQSGYPCSVWPFK